MGAWRQLPFNMAGMPRGIPCGAVLYECSRVRVVTKIWVPNSHVFWAPPCLARLWRASVAAVMAHRARCVARARALRCGEGGGLQFSCRLATRHGGPGFGAQTVFRRPSKEGVSVLSPRKESQCVDKRARGQTTLPLGQLVDHRGAESRGMPVQSMCQVGLVMVRCAGGGRPARSQTRRKQPAALGAAMSKDVQPGWAPESGVQRQQHQRMRLTAYNRRTWQGKRKRGTQSVRGTTRSVGKRHAPGLGVVAAATQTHTQRAVSQTREGHIHAQTQY